ncbi:rhs family protein [Elysia marginata]|uniref:Rhs family protein n=1 Tax=Elysia marginata TaxID=1093978 RepID=A0AAV4EZ53_9GAST|nr:rhs family protein [Elysia marginata]
MNGRVFDPILGRFLETDIVVQFPELSQSFNRYSYVLNGPLSFVDPSGYTATDLLSDFYLSQQFVPDQISDDWFKLNGIVIDYSVPAQQPMEIVAYDFNSSPVTTLNEAPSLFTEAYLNGTTIAEQKITLMANGSNFYFNALDRNDICGSQARSCNLNLSSDPLKMGLIGVHKYPGLYISTHTEEYQRYSDALMVDGADFVGKRANEASLMYPPSAPLAQAVGLASDMVKVYYSDDKADAAIGVVAENLGGTLAKKAIQAKNPYVSESVEVRAEAIGARLVDESN